MRNLSGTRAVLVSIAVCGAAMASAQYGGGNRPWAIRTLVDRAERSSNTFRDIVEHREDLSDYRINDRRRDPEWEKDQAVFFDALKPVVQRMDESFEHLRRIADNHRPRYGRDEMADVMRYASDVEHFMNNYRSGKGIFRPTWYRGPVYTLRGSGFRISDNLTRKWADVRQDINALANAYDLPPINANRWEYRRDNRRY